MVKLRQKKRCRQQTVNPKNTLSYRIAARFLRTGRLFLCLAARISRAFIFADAITGHKAGKAKAQHCNKVNYAHSSALLSLDSFPRFPSFLVSRSIWFPGSGYLIGGSQSLRNTLAGKKRANRPPSFRGEAPVAAPKGIMAYMMRNIKQRR